jgi:rhamnosyl/mannosyltransferase
MTRRGHESCVLVSVPRGWGTHETVTRTASLGVVKSVPLSPTFLIHFWQASRDADIVHHLPTPLSVVSHLATPPTNAPVVAMYHSDIIRQQTALKPSRPFLHRFLDDIDHTFVTSPRLLNNSEHLAPYREKASVVPLSIDLDHYGQYGGPPVDLPGDSDRPTLLFVGQLNYYKGVEYLLDAMPAVDANLLIAASGGFMIDSVQLSDPWGSASRWSHRTSRSICRCSTGRSSTHSTTLESTSNGSRSSRRSTSRLSTSLVALTGYTVR